ncbi:MAG: SMC-Scp complex subunit ScpB [Candidatus Omnitrophica bacterium]|nr:SMC-Scp complex subunit ScpB [Candidatus Omnitrophota bacterium]
MVDKNIEKIIEALLFSSEKSLPLDKIVEILGGVEQDSIKEAVSGLNEYYKSEDRSFHVEEIAGGYQLVTKPEYGVWLNKLYKKPQDKLRGPSLETLAIIVYRQPITKSEIEAIRGVNVDSVLKTLIEKNLIKIRGRKDSPGRPLLYGTTEDFLQRFGLNDLKSLPPLKEFCESDLDYEKKQMVQKKFPAEEVVLQAETSQSGTTTENTQKEEVKDEPKEPQA